MNRDLLQERFRERAARSRRDFLLFAVLAAVISLAVAAGVGFFLYTMLAMLYLPLSWPWFALIYLALFFGIGYAQYSRKATDTSQEPEAPDTWTAWYFPEVGLLWLLWYLFNLPSLIFFFFREVITGRYLFASDEVETLAFEILQDGGDKISPEFLKSKSDSHPEALAPAIHLLLEMKFLILRRGRESRSLLRSIAGREFLESGEARS